MKRPYDASTLTGKLVRLREVEISDAAFILSLRCDPKKSAHLHQTENNVQKQIDYLKYYKTLDNEWYFIIEDFDSTPLGTYRICDLRDDSFGSGSWLMIDDADPFAGVEADYLLKRFAFEVLGYEKGHFDVRKANKKVVRYHKSMGGEIASEDDLNYYFNCYKNVFLPKAERLLEIIS